MSAILKALPLPHGRKFDESMSQVLTFFPCRNFGDRVYLYAMGFKGGVVKVGISLRPRERLRDHWRRASGEVEWIHLFTRMQARTAREAERLALAKLKAMAPKVHGSEWFIGGLPKQDVIAVVRECIDESRTRSRDLFEREAKRHAIEDIAARALMAAGFSREDAKSIGLYLPEPEDE